MKIILHVLLIIPLLFVSLQAQRGLQLKQMKEEQRVALVIGNNNYNNLSKLKNPINDARAMRNVLKARGFEVIYKENASKKDMKKLLKNFSHKLSKGGVGLYYFAGHGINVDGHNFLVGTDSVMEAKDEVEFETLALNRITKKMKNANNRLNIIILDACRNDPFSRSGGGGLAPVSDAKGMFVAYATEAGAVASDGRDGKNGVFTKYLVKNMKEKGLSIERVFKNTRADVLASTKGKQSPGVYNQIVGDFYFTLPTGTVEASPTLNTLSTDSSSAENAMWAMVQEDNTLKNYKYFISKYPGSQYVPAAKHKISKFTSDEITQVRIKQTQAKIKQIRGLEDVVVLDGLMWQDNLDTKRTKKDWEGAKNYCKSLTLNGYTDWYLPNKEELLSIVDRKRYPAIKKELNNVTDSSYWSSTSYSYEHNLHAWNIYFKDSKSYYNFKTEQYYVRCVRGALQKEISLVESKPNSFRLDEVQAVIKKAVNNNFNSIKGKPYTNNENIKIIDEFIKGKSDFINTYIAMGMSSYEGLSDYETQLSNMKIIKNFHCNRLASNCTFTMNEEHNAQAVNIKFSVSNLQESNKKVTQLKNSIKEIIYKNGKDDWTEIDTKGGIGSTEDSTNHFMFLSMKLVINIFNGMNPVISADGDKSSMYPFIKVSITKIK